MIGMIIGHEAGIIWREISAIAGIAQLAEQRIRNAWVGGSNPLSGTIFKEVLNQFQSRDPARKDLGSSDSIRDSCDTGMCCQNQ